MQKRRSHTKSRRGCLNCKKQHVKCDEQGPPCANCEVRQVQCTYSPAATKKRAKSKPAPKQNGLPVSPIDPAGHGRNKRQDKSASLPSPETLKLSSSQQSHEQQVAMAKGTAYNPITPSPVAFSSSLSPISTSHLQRDSSRLLELELMSRWHTRTFSMFHSFPEDDEWLTTAIPRDALELDYVMNGIFSLAAIDIARSSTDEKSRKKYACIGLEYQSLTTSGIVSRLGDINKTNITNLYGMAAGVAHFHFVLAWLNGVNPLDRLGGLYDKMLGASNIIMADYHGFVEVTGQAQVMNVHMARLSEMEGGGQVLLDETTKTVLARAAKVVDVVCGLHPPAAPELRARKAMCQAAVSGLGTGFTVDAAAFTENFCFFSFSVGGPDFVTAIKALDPLALFILMHMAVMLHRCHKKYPGAWWVGNTGQELALQLKGIIEVTPLVGVVGVRENMRWILEQVGAVAPQDDPDYGELEQEESPSSTWSGVTVVNQSRGSDKGSPVLKG